MRTVPDRDDDTEIAMRNASDDITGAFPLNCSEIPNGRRRVELPFVEELEESILT